MARAVDGGRSTSAPAPGSRSASTRPDVGPADYLLFVDRKPVGVIEAKPEDWGQKITAVEEQSTGYADATLKWLNSAEPRPFVYESTGRAHPFHRPARSEAALAGGVQLSSAGHDAGVARAAGVAARTPSRPS